MPNDNRTDELRERIEGLDDRTIITWVDWGDDGITMTDGTLCTAAELKALLTAGIDAEISRESRTCVWLSNGTKIRIKRDGLAAWLEVVQTPIVQAAAAYKSEETI